MSASRQLRLTAQLDKCLGHHGKPFIHIILVGEQLLTARVVLHALEMSVPCPVQSDRPGLLPLFGYVQ
jgi:hypothetical protein